MHVIGPRAASKSGSAIQAIVAGQAPCHGLQGRRCSQRCSTHASIAVSKQCCHGMKQHHDSQLFCLLAGIGSLLSGHPMMIRGVKKKGGGGPMHLLSPFPFSHHLSQNPFPAWALMCIAMPQVNAGQALRHADLCQENKCWDGFAASFTIRSLNLFSRGEPALWSASCILYQQGCPGPLARHLLRIVHQWRMRGQPALRRATLTWTTPIAP